MTDRRRKLTDKEKDAIIARQGGVCPGLPHRRIECGLPLTRDTAVFDHIEQRTFTKSDDVNEFQALCAAGRTSCNSIKTYGIPGAGSAGSDANKRAKVRRAKRKPRRKRKIPSRPFSKGHRPLRSRNNLRRKP